LKRDLGGFLKCPDEGDGRSTAELARLAAARASRPRHVPRVGDGSYQPTIPQGSPTIDAGEDQNVFGLSSEGTLSASIETNAFSVGATVLWEQESSNGVITFEDATALETTFTASEAGEYTLRCTASGPYGTGSDTLTVTVYASPLDTHPDELYAWFRAAPEYRTLAGTKVSMLTDLSGHGNSVSQGTVAQQPTWRESGGMNNLPYLEHNGGSSLRRLVAAGIDGAPGNTEACAMFAVGRSRAEQSTSPSEPLRRSMLMQRRGKFDALESNGSNYSAYMGDGNGRTLSGSNALKWVVYGCWQTDATTWHHELYDEDGAHVSESQSITFLNATGMVDIAVGGFSAGASCGVGDFHEGCKIKGFITAEQAAADFAFLRAFYGFQ
jgi:hypothetical protein